MAGEKVMELYELRYSDLTTLSSCDVNSSGAQRLEMVKGSMMEALGPSGPGLICVTGVPKASTLRLQLLPLARQLALLSPEKRKMVLQEHNLGSDVSLKNPGRKVSSFAMQLQYGQFKGSEQRKAFNGSDESFLDTEKEREPWGDEFAGLEGIFMELGFCMMELGLSIARICDQVIGGNVLEQSLMESFSAKGRLIHYHAATDKAILMEAVKKKRPVKTKASGEGDQKHWLRCLSTKSDNSEANVEDKNFDIHSNLWQQWHYDYGIFTVLTAPMFLSSDSAFVMPPNELLASSDLECVSPCGNSCLRIYHPGKNMILTVKTPPDSFIIQVGESADVLSKGKLRSTLHCVGRPDKLEDISRETFVVFLQPAWSKIFWVSDYLNQIKLDSPRSCNSVSNDIPDEETCKVLSGEIKKIVPPLSLRLKDGMTFAEFSRETTKQYYGGGGLQSNR